VWGDHDEKRLLLPLHVLWLDIRLLVAITLYPVLPSRPAVRRAFLWLLAKHRNTPCQTWLFSVSPCPRGRWGLPLPGYPTASQLIPDWRRFEGGTPPPGFDPIRPQATPDDPMLRASAEGRRTGPLLRDPNCQLLFFQRSKNASQP
jgi:hypothetical protein